MYLRIETWEFIVESGIPLIPKGVSARMCGLALYIPIVVLMGRTTATSATILHVPSIWTISILVGIGILECKLYELGSQ